MKPSFAPFFRGLQQSLLSSASPLVPANQRAEWSREWQSELWHVRRACVPIEGDSWRAEREATAFCFGAIYDAICLRRHAWQSTPPFYSTQGAASKCLLWLVAILASSYALAALLPGVQIESHPSWYQVRPGTILIQNARHTNDAGATISVQRYRFWKSQRQAYFDGFAFYRMSHETISSGAKLNPGLEVAHASSNLFSLLGLASRFSLQADQTGQDLPGAILSEDLWRRNFGADPGIVGSTLQVGGRPARIVGIEPDGAWRLPGKPDAWLLEADSEIGAGGLGYVVAHLTSLGRSEMWTHRVHINTYDGDDADEDLWGISFEERTRGPWEIYRFTVLLAFLALPAITSVSLGEYSANSHRLSWPRRIRRWCFLAAKIVLLLPIVYYASLDLGFWFTTHYSPAAQYIQLLSSFSICLFGLRWMLMDQRQRCPVCLRRVTNPARVGHASWTFLAWNGTELMCLGGHTLLLVPGLPTSWFSTPRWLYLDTTWDFLFAGSGVG
jgi:hypothetical protein